ncbi:PrsW family glutamic-type intramembrane protease [Pelagicoccus sp. SDUM812005]|uniref:PrsW family glutamic-type intramembrane protease n=1 Tax=Pelagicoccus sp. SDUM812005 TaxID=3041257 RepID=UPI00280C9126|nr:PrsW family glutamic-type intramembrane protease [Pelagicoccus sp. SDUM812005]MDQ8182545.1 PrsW family glutamic-type intramembrane protease [Pelagicoccus sp. SDUM812005]
MNKRQAYELTRSSSFLWKSSALLLILIIGLGFAAWKLKPQDHRSPSPSERFIFLGSDTAPIAVNTAQYEEAVRAELWGDTPLPQKLYALQYLLSLPSSALHSTLPPRAQLARLSDGEYALLAAFAEAAREGSAEKRPPSGPSLRELCEREPPPPYANFALSLFYTLYPKNGSAIQAARSEAKAHPSDAAHQRLVALYDRHNLLSELRPLLDDPNYAPFIDSLLRRDIALETMDWPVLLKTLFPVAYQDLPPSILLLALVAGGVWVSLILRFGGELSWKSTAVKGALPALLLGALSAHLTILAIYFQEDQLGLSRGDDLLSQAIYCVAGIGLREEFLKLLCFAPLIPFLAKQKDELATLILASLVGLGFAIEENISYFEQSQGLAAFGRFVTANFFHLALTGVCGLTLAQAYRYRGAYINTAVSTFGLAVLAHGAYDAFIIVPELRDYNLVSSVVFILASYQYFIWLRHLRPNWNDTISLSAHFTWGLVLVFGASYLLLAWDRGPMESATLLIEETLSLGILLVMFYREIPEDIY